MCWAGINLDISRLKKTEAELREREAALEAADRKTRESGTTRPGTQRIDAPGALRPKAGAQSHPQSTLARDH